MDKNPENRIYCSEKWTRKDGQNIELFEYKDLCIDIGLA